MEVCHIQQCLLANCCTTEHQQWRSSVSNTCTLSTLSQKSQCDCRRKRRQSHWLFCDSVDRLLGPTANLRLADKRSRTRERYNTEHIIHSKNVTTAMRFTTTHAQHSSMIQLFVENNDWSASLYTVYIDVRRSIKVRPIGVWWPIAVIIDISPSRPHTNHIQPFIQLFSTFNWAWKHRTGRGV